ncbi:hypothetical protein OHA70_14375 [Kribbella sp. NBC_00382]|uniref:hypothetical protein n=1 Tax=Kribbella sp. NBC_00382 TaxID=2975967 RepID=UPI002E1B5531
MLDWLRKRRARARAEAAEAALIEQTRQLGARARGLAKRGQIREAAGVLSNSGNPRSEIMLVGLLKEFGYPDRAITIAQSSADPEVRRILDGLLRERGGRLAQSSLLATLDGTQQELTEEAGHLLEGGLIDEAIELLKASRLPADRTRLEALLGELHRTDELRDLPPRPLRAGLQRVGREKLRSVPEPAGPEVETGQEVVDGAQVAEAIAELGSVADPARKNAAGRIIDRLIGQRRIGTAIAFATVLLNAGDEWAEAWIPRPPLARIGGREVTHRQLLIAETVTAIRKLLDGCSAG